MVAVLGSVRDRVAPDDAVAERAVAGAAAEGGGPVVRDGAVVGGAGHQAAAVVGRRRRRVVADDEAVVEGASVGAAAAGEGCLRTADPVARDGAAAEGAAVDAAARAHASAPIRVLPVVRARDVAEDVAVLDDGRFRGAGAEDAAALAGRPVVRDDAAADRSRVVADVDAAAGMVVRRAGVVGDDAVDEEAGGRTQPDAARRVVGVAVVLVVADHAVGDGSRRGGDAGGGTGIAVAVPVFNDEAAQRGRRGEGDDAAVVAGADAAEDDGLRIRVVAPEGDGLGDREGHGQFIHVVREADRVLRRGGGDGVRQVVEGGDIEDGRLRGGGDEKRRKQNGARETQCVFHR